MPHFFPGRKRIPGGFPEEGVQFSRTPKIYLENRKTDESRLGIRLNAERAKIQREGQANI
jgi:hypothetical protein